MNPYAPPKAAEKIMNERTERMIQGCRRENRRMCNLIRRIRPIAIAGHPEGHIAFVWRGRHRKVAPRVICLTTKMPWRPCEVLEVGRRRAVR
jgi:hypothetical protein